MKKLLIILIGIFLIGCKKPGQQSQTTPTVSGTFTFSFNGNSVSGYTKFCMLQNGYLLIAGNSNSDNSANPQSAFYAYIKMTTNDISVGQYTTSDVGDEVNFSSLNHIINFTAVYDIYSASNTYSKAKIIFNVISYNSTTKYITCTFSGTLQWQSNNNLYTVTNGSIYGTIN
jgi:hypothetical protein